MGLYKLLFTVFFSPVVVNTWVLLFSGSINPLYGQKLMDRDKFFPNIEGAYQFGNGSIATITGQGLSGTTTLREVSSGNIYNLNKHCELHYRSGSNLSDTIYTIDYYFKPGVNNRVAIEIRDGLKSTRVGEKLPLREQLSYFESSDLKLYGKLVLPEGKGPFPTAVVAQGSSDNSAIKNYHHPYLFASHGIATFVYDKRGTGLSEGQYTQLFDVLSDDLVAAVNYLSEHPSIDPKRIGVAGFSQGGWIGPLAASKSDHIKFVLVGYGLAISVAMEDWIETPRKLQALGYSGTAIEELKDLNNAIHNALKTGFSSWDEIEKKVSLYKDKDWYQAIATTQTWAGSLANMGLDNAKQLVPGMLKTFSPFYDPIETLKSLNIPMLWLIAENDLEAPPEITVERLKELKADFGKDIVIRIYPNADHGMLEFELSNKNRKYTKYAEGYLTDMIDWLQGQVDLKPSLNPDQKIAHFESLAIVGVNVISMVNEEVKLNQTVIIEDGKITDIRPTKTDERLHVQRTINAQGKYLLPGLHDMHTHLESNLFPRAFGINEPVDFPFQEILFPYLANGVTTIQIMSGGEDLLKLREDITNGKILGPRLIVGSPMIDGNPPILPPPITIPITDPQPVDSILSDLKVKGYDFIKIRANLSKRVFDEIHRSAEEQDMYLKGHIPRGEGLSLPYVLEKGSFGVAHLEEFGYDSSSPGPEAIDNYIKLLKENQAHVITTLNVFDNIIDKMTDYESTLERDQVAYVHPFLKNSLWSNNPFRQESNQQRLQEIRSQLKTQQVLTKKFYQAGIPVMLGTDALSPTIVPGFSVHRELVLIVESGMTPYQALELATTIPARHLNPDDPEAGTLAVNQAADLLILDDNPLINLGTLKNPFSVIINGFHIDQLTIKETLNGVSDKFANSFKSN